MEAQRCPWIGPIEPGEPDPGPDRPSLRRQERRTDPEALATARVSEREEPDLV